MARPAWLAAPLRLLSRRRWLPFRHSLTHALAPPRALPPHEFETDFFGLRYRGRLDDEIDWNVFFFGSYAPAELHLLAALAGHLRRDRDRITFVDVGANVGNHTLFMSRHADRVFAFEPWGEVASRLERHVALNRLENVALHRVALGNAAAGRDYHEPAAGHLGRGSLLRQGPGATARTVPVQEVQGDAYFAAQGIPRVDLLKIDVEGYERRVLEGLRARLLADRPAILMELKDVGQAELESEAVLRSLVYPDAILAGVASSRSRDFRLTGFSFEATDEVLILPPELRSFLDTHPA